MGAHETVDSIATQISGSFKIAPVELFEAVSKDTRFKQFGRFYILFRTNAHFQRAFEDGFFIGCNYISGRRVPSDTSELTGTGVSEDANKSPIRPVRTGYIPNIPPWICQDDVPLLLAPYGQVVSLATDKAKNLGIQTGGVHFAIRLNVDQPMPDRVRVLNVNYAVLYPGKRQKTTTTTPTPKSSSVPEEPSAGDQTVKGLDTSPAAPGDESPINETTTPSGIQSIQADNEKSMTITNQSEQIKPALHQITISVDDSAGEEMPTDESHNKINSGPETETDSEAETGTGTVSDSEEAEEERDIPSEAVALTTVGSTHINQHKHPRSNSTTDVSQSASTIAPASEVELPPAKTTALSENPDYERPISDHL